MVLRALVRPGRFDRVIAVPLPDVRGRMQILQQYMKEVVTAPGKSVLNSVLPLPISTCFLEVDPSVLARGTPGFSGADLQNMVK